MFKHLQFAAATGSHDLKTCAAVTPLAWQWRIEEPGAGTGVDVVSKMHYYSIN